MSTKTTREEIRCCGPDCGVLLGVLVGDSLVVKRAGLQLFCPAKGYFHIICYNPKCSHLNVVRLPKPELVAAAN